MTSIPVTWATGHHCKNGDGQETLPCAFSRDIDSKGGSSSGTLQAGSARITVNAWFAGVEKIDFQLLLNNSALDLTYPDADKQTSPKSICQRDEGVNIDKEFCKDSVAWYRFDAACHSEVSTPVLSFSWADSDKATVVIEAIVTGTLSGGTPASTPTAIIPVLTSDSTTTSSATTDTLNSSPTSSVAYSTSLPTKQGSDGAASPTAAAVSERVGGHRHSKASTIAPAVVVPVAFLLAALAAFLFWRRHKRLARVAPSARFKGESPEMKPWLPLDAQRSASRQDYD
ncbi:hypothetical protein AURDEDRAFT_126195 [Auricularia subglabra TFB-10046 SS5]|nr:hypothetical protein AURDEDRAFT_126195 [Auricularia subglabra TFB-10046 SS5]